MRAIVKDKASWITLVTTKKSVVICLGTCRGKLSARRPTRIHRHGLRRVLPIAFDRRRESDFECAAAVPKTANGQGPPRTGEIRRKIDIRVRIGVFAF